MAEPEIPPTTLDFRKLSQGIAALKTTVEAVQAGKMADLTDTPEKTFGDIDPNLLQDTEKLVRFAGKRMEACSQSCIDTFDAILRAEIAAAALFEATETHANATSQVYVGNDADKKHTDARLSRLTEITDGYQEEPWEDKNAATALKDDLQPMLKAEYLEHLQGGRHQYTLRNEALETVTQTSLKAGLARLDHWRRSSAERFAGRSAGHKALRGHVSASSLLVHANCLDDFIASRRHSANSCI